MITACPLQFSPRLALEEVCDAPVEVWRLARDAEKILSALARFRPDRAARAFTVRDAMCQTAKGHLAAMCEWRRLGQPPEPRRDPCAVPLREVTGIPQAATRRDGQHHLARRGVDAQRVAPRLFMPAQAHQEHGTVEDNFDRR